MTTKSASKSTLHTVKFNSVRFITLTGVLTALGAVLQYLEFPLPMFIPPFVKFDFGDLPAILAAFLVSPISGVIVCLLKNLIHYAVTQSAGIGELCNFLLGVCMVVPAWFVYKIRPTKKTAALAMLAGALVSAVCSVFINYFISYPFYGMFMPMDEIMNAYREILPSAGSLFGFSDPLWEVLILFNAPFTFVKFVVDSVVVFFIYKPLAKSVRGFDR